MADRYRQNAHECVRLAEASGASESKRILLMMALGWMKMRELATHPLQPPADEERRQPTLRLVN